MRWFLAGVAALALASPTAPPAAAAEPPGLIFDTDICGDCDDVLALGMIHSLQSRGACRLLAVTVSVDNDKAAPFVDAVNTFYGRGDIPIGVVGKGGVVEQGKYLPLVDAKDESGRDRYPHDLRSGKDAPPATSVLRKVLAAQPDESVVIAQVGFSTNLARLLETGPDEDSPLSGIELVAKKVKLLSLMAGAFEPIDGNANYREYNVHRDIPSCRKVAAGWPSPVVFSGFEIGIAVPYPAVSIERDYAYVKHHPLPEAYILYLPPPHNRPTWDLTSVLYAVLPDRGYFDLSPNGKVTVAETAETRFATDPAGKHRYLILKPEQRGRVVEALVQLSSQPPRVLEGPRP
ncbi:Inosine-uridine preferring nucleoside hydrolase [Aquisphaera giovannonii]|uniref:Inosine-uridine preferring nucleoside hydrolase n=1 Tax=Aquisphaera giovannonii TaxID=406548 RepID=A0A5B9VZY5_9BACT|nr:nucleoside hydrolase [Aquisphaera giovannonii]QEH33547.1 Inosine-uridine preferring nucleoside hydrolase [Aquisphaera giovannonii]